ncbi:MAG: S-layer homology domain-containing protein [Armatimonadetes bacterium]|nr:S-layer homology domain-containing protein [Armatimonadota bacterium]
MFRKTLFFLLICTICAGIPALLAAPFPDLPAKHWAFDAVNQLSQKGLLEGYPDGTFKGDRAASRYEVAMVVARIVAKVEKLSPADLSKYATKNDLNALRRLVDEFRKELDALGVRVGQIEEKLSSLEARVFELERVRVHGHLDTIGGSIGLRPGTNFVPPPAGAAGAAGFDFATGRPLMSETFLTSLASLDVMTRLSDEYDGGLSLDAYGIVGNPAPGRMASYWGASSPWLNNWWTGTAAGAGAGAGNVTNKMVLDNLWVRHVPSDTIGTVGTFGTTTFDPFVMRGQPNPTYFGPDYIPFFGGQLRGPVHFRTVPYAHYELVVIDVADPNAYTNPLWGGHVDSSWDKLHVSLNFYRLQNDTAGFAAFPSIAAPLTNPWTVVNYGGGAGSGDDVGPQDMNAWGLAASYDVSPSTVVRLEYASTQYDPDRTGTVDRVSGVGTRTGNLFAGKVSSKVWGGDLGLQYISVEPEYDPFLLQYPLVFTVNPGAVITFIQQVQGSRNWAVWNTLSNYYFMHDTVNYPHNRQGPKINYGHRYKWGGFSVNGSFLQQKFANSALNTAAHPVYVEAVFPVTTPASTIGTVNSWGGALDYQFQNKLLAKLNAGVSTLERAEDTALAGADNWSAQFSSITLGLEYPITNSLSIQGDHVIAALRGTQNGFTGIDVVQNRSTVGLGYQIAPQTAVSVGYRWFNTRETTSPAANTVFGNWDGTQLYSRLLIDF